MLFFRFQLQPILGLTALLLVWGCSGGGDTAVDPCANNGCAPVPGDVSLTVTVTFNEIQSPWPDSSFTVSGSSSATASQANGSASATVDSTVVVGLWGHVPSARR
jgi:hypothetical protein